MQKILSKLDAHVRLILALVVSCIGFVLTIGRFEPAVQAIAVWNEYAWSVIFLSWLRIAILVGGAKGMGHKALTEHLLLAAATVVSSWFLMHTVFTMHYAHAYYRDDDNDPNTIGSGGLEFPNEKEPDFLDFAYFSFVIGMTCQVSDVQISSQGIRRLALVHGLLSFLFNTVVLALAINLASGLL